VQFAFSDDTVLYESVERATNTRSYPSRIRCTILGKTHKRRFTSKWSLEFHTTKDKCGRRTTSQLSRVSQKTQVQEKMIETRENINEEIC
jgi:hypothetical protein